MFLCYREHSRAAGDMIASTRRWPRFGKMDGSTPWPGGIRPAAAIAEKAAPYVHPKVAPRAEEGGDKELTIKIIGGLPE
jgi:hypothetical protein